MLGLYVVSLATTISGMEIISFLILSLLIGVLVMKKNLSLPPLPAMKPMLLLCFAILLSILLGDASIKDKIYDLGRLRFFLLYAALFYYFHVFQLKLEWVKWLAVITLLVGIYSFFQHFMHLDLFRPDGKKTFYYVSHMKQMGYVVVGTFNHHLTFSNVYLFFATLFLSISIFHFPKKLYFVPLSLLLYLLVFWTYSRISWVAIPLTMVPLCYKKSKVLLISVAVIFVGLFMLAYFNDAGLREKIRYFTLDIGCTEKCNLRSRFWKTNLQMFFDHPFFGIGFNQNERHCQEYMDKIFPDRINNYYGHAHSTPLQFLSTTGLFGIFAYIFFWVSIFREMSRGFFTNHRTFEWWILLGIFSAFIGFHIQGITQYNFGDAEVLHNVMFFLAVSMVLSKSNTLPSH